MSWQALSRSGIAFMIGDPLASPYQVGTHRESGAFPVTQRNRLIDALMFDKHALGPLLRSLAGDAQREYHRTLYRILDRFQHMDEQLVATRLRDGPVECEVCLIGQIAHVERCAQCVQS